MAIKEKYLVTFAIVAILFALISFAEPFVERLGLPHFLPEGSYEMNLFFAFIYYSAWLILLYIVCWFAWQLTKDTFAEAKADFRKQKVNWGKAKEGYTLLYRRLKRIFKRNKRPTKN